MLPRKNRLTKNNDFLKVYSQGRHTNGSFLALKAMDNHLPYFRVAFIVSKKISTKATERNLVKRRLREAVKNILGSIKAGYDIVIFSKTNIRGQKFLEIQNEITGAFHRAKLVK
ncbi:MAG: ribonuclease P protein component [Candidatus Gribaldobacteria bacterium]|nr:ribonuclease P protein component [Candidatus Gribaldobacteria bacterium]